MRWLMAMALVAGLNLPATAQEAFEPPAPPGIGSDLLEAATETPTPDRPDPAAVLPTTPDPPAGETPLEPADTGMAPQPVAHPDPVPTPAPAEPAPSVRALLRDLWRSEVAGGLTDLGFDAWLAREVGTGPPAAPPRPDTQPERIRAVSERWESRTGPVALGQAGRVVTTFGAAIPTAFCSPLTVCYIELEPGEVLTDTPSWGDTARWQVAAKVQGREPETVVLEVKPAGDAETTNLVIPTDRRLYTITLVNDAEVHTPILSFRWPDSEAHAIADRIAAREETEAAAERSRGGPCRHAGAQRCRNVHRGACRRRA